MMTMQQQVDPNVPRHSFEDMVLGHDEHEHWRITYSDRHAVLAEIFPYLYTQGRRYYSFVSSEGGRRSVNEESTGDVALANKRGETLRAYTKQRILMADRRFGEFPESLFFMMDTIEKKSIHSYNRRVVASQPDVTITREMVHNGVNFLADAISSVPHTIRSSYAHKRQHSLNLTCIFENLGSPQLFITLTCDDFPDYFKKHPAPADSDDNEDDDQLLDDPILFEKRFKRNF